MERREFLKTLGFLGALAAFPNLLSSPIESPPKFLGLVTYSLGFTVSQELIDDDMYGTLFDLGGMAKVMAEELDREMAEKYGVPRKRRSRKQFREEYRPIRLLSY